MNECDDWKPVSMCNDELENLLDKPTVSVPEAGAALGMAKNASYLAAQNGEFPLPVIRIGGKMRVPTAALRRLLYDSEVAAPKVVKMSEARRMQIACYDCGRGYGEEYGFPDFVVPHDVWAKIAPDDGNGLLCPSCMIRRMSLLGLKGVKGVFTSGPCS